MAENRSGGTTPGTRSVSQSVTPAGSIPGGAGGYPVVASHMPGTVTTNPSQARIVGFDNIDVEAATEAGVVVCNTPGILDETTADLAFLLVLAAARRSSEAE